MRSMSKVLVFLAVLLFMSWQTCLAEDSSCVEKTDKAEAAAPAEEGTNVQEAARTVEGTITFIERDGTLVLKDQAGKSGIVYVRNESRIFRDSKEITRNDLKIGDTISARVDPMRKALEVRTLKQTP